MLAIRKKAAFAGFTYKAPRRPSDRQTADGLFDGGERSDTPGSTHSAEAIGHEPVEELEQHFLDDEPLSPTRSRAISL